MCGAGGLEGRSVRLQSFIEASGAGRVDCAFFYSEVLRV